MKPLFIIFLLFVVTGCSAIPQERAASPCDKSEASMECQIERYNNVNAD